ncbi:uncharacterized protein LOC133321959 [Musca vetustissima]|uniref:uncharacterized protein LOC133321959 n=1 Tax=Musca vetustissima TaxID=27455 RepID=UPI002AB67DF4|nr:uncharacterized protein LOC133321959 [Musca vetustissima]
MNEFENFDAHISLEDPLKDYEKLIEDKLKADIVISNDTMNKIWNKISTAARERVWQLLFEDNSNKETNDHLEKAAGLLKMLKEDSCFYSPWEYNEWIIRLRDELLQRKMLAFWKNIIVAQELGPAWARDSDLFEDSDDLEPAKFYEYGGCKAPWLAEEKSKNMPNSNVLEIKPISLETPLEDYKRNMELQIVHNSVEKNAFESIFANVRDIIWQLLFKKEVDSSYLNDNNIEKATSLLRQYKQDACHHSPYDYNNWIEKVKEELLNRQQFDFWQNVIVKEQLGLCWSGDSKGFQNLEEEMPKEFYEYDKGREMFDIKQ